MLQGGAGEQSYLLDYAGNAMRLAGFSMLQVQDGDGRIVSSGHFRNEFDRLEPGLPRLLAATPEGIALVRARTAEAPFLALARVDSFRLVGKPFTLVGGVTVDSAFLAHLAPDSALVVSLDTVERAEAPPPPPGGVVDSLVVPAVATDAARLVSARIVVAHSLAGLDALRHDVDRWFVVTLALAGAIALLLAGWLSLRISRPLTALAEQTARIDMDRLDVAFSSDRRDEIGALTRLLGAMTERLRAGAARLREARPGGAGARRRPPPPPRSPRPGGGAARGGMWGGGRARRPGGPPGGGGGASPSPRPPSRLTVGRQPASPSPTRGRA